MAVLDPWPMHDFVANAAWFPLKLSFLKIVNSKFVIDSVKQISCVTIRNLYIYDTNWETLFSLIYSACRETKVV